MDDRKCTKRCVTKKERERVRFAELTCTLNLEDYYEKFTSLVRVSSRRKSCFVVVLLFDFENFNDYNTVLVLILV